MTNTTRKLRLTAIRYAAADTNTYEFEATDGSALPAYEPGAHIDLHLPGVPALIRQYSLCRPHVPARGNLVGIKLDRASRGGSRYVHDELKVGATIEVGGPRNNFPLHEGAAPAIEGGFVVVLSRSGRELSVPAGKTILEVLRDAGLSVTSSCEQGVCGTCETRVIAGRPDHRDILLSAQEKTVNKTMMICCSGSLDARLVLDL